MADPVVVPVREFMGVNKVLIHEQWGAPMNFHRLTRVEHDLVRDETYLYFDNFYNMQVALNGGMAMSNKAIALTGASMLSEADLLQRSTELEDSVMNGGTLETSQTDE